MAQGRFTKEEGQQTIEAIKEMFDAIPKTRRMEYIGHLNDICLFVEAAIKNAPNEAKTEVLKVREAVRGDENLHSDV